MNISFADFKKEVETLQQDIRTQLKTRETPDRTLIEDGIVNLEEYYSCPTRIMWILKEPYGGGGWSMTHQINTIRALGTDRGAHHTWYPITYATYGILNGFLPFAAMPEINSDPAVWLSLRKIAYVNFQKLPGKTRTNERELRNQVTAEERQLLIRQIETYRPHIVIGGGILHLLRKELGFTKEHELPNGHFQKNGVLYLHMYHPAQTKLTMQAYVDKIRERAMQWQKVYQGGAFVL